jgi:monofunctional biosynthetic peptidoglycan transglycosylase
MASPHNGRLDGTLSDTATAPSLVLENTATGAKAPRRNRTILARTGAWLALGALAALFVTIAMVLPWRWFAPPTSAFILREKLLNGTAVQHRWVSWDRISRYLPIAVVAAEDQKFPLHHGFDFESIAQALEDERGPRRGASTISQQVVKNLFLWPGRSYVRKGLEAYLTILIEAFWPKRRILEIYLNVAEFGPGIFGAEAASREFFAASASRLSLWEASLLAAVLPSPKRMSARDPSDYVRRRAWEIRTWVQKLGGARYLDDI